MATVDGEGAGIERVSALLDRFGLDWVHVLVFDVVVVALLARLYDLGARVAHWDEARVAYWTVRYMETGNVEYRPIIHGPFYHHVNKHLFAAFGTTDATMRLFVAVVGGLFPLVALLFRDRLRDSEVVALALLFAINPLLLYYSRFMRGDPLVAMFMFAAFALFVRALDTRRTRYVYAGVFLSALGLAVKENALLYPVCWFGAGVLATDGRLLRTGGPEEDPTVTVGRYLRVARERWRRYATVAAIAAVEFLAVTVYFYAPRSATDPGPGLWTVFEDPSVAPDVVSAATVGAAGDLWGIWIAGSHQDHAYLPFLGDFLLTMAVGALAVSLLSVVGVLADRYGDRGPAGLASFCFYWGLASVIGYPVVTDIMAPWATVNAVVPLAVPAAVGLALVGRWSYRAYSQGDHLASGTVAYSLVVVVLVVAAASAGTVYAQPQSGDNELVQYAQPGGDIRPVMDRLAVAAAENEGPDVLFYGDYFVDGGDASVPRQPGCVRWFNALPLPWYVATTDADVTCANSSQQVGTVVSESQPPVVVVRTDSRGAVAGDLSDYESRTYLLRAWDTETTFYVHADYADGLPPAESRDRGTERVN